MSIDVTKVRIGGAFEGIQRGHLPVFASSGTTPETGNATRSFDIMGRELFITNDSSADMTVTINCLAGTLGWVLHTGETFNERLPEFSSFTVTSGGEWRWYARGNIT